MPIIELVFGGAVLLAVLMTVLWFVQRRTRDAGIVDAAWAGGIGLLTVIFAVAGPGVVNRRILVGVMGSIWAFRLALHILKDRVLSGDEDGRYQALRKQWGDAFEPKIFVFFQVQALLAVLFALPILAAMLSTRQGLGLIDIGALMVWLIAVSGESIADRQLAHFRNDPLNRGRTCRVGLWRFSRHPNYFFEWLHWWAYALAAIASPMWWIAAAAPMIMLFFIFFVTGIPPTEERALLSRGDDYRRYQRTTSAFIPWFPKDVKEER